MANSLPYTVVMDRCNANDGKGSLEYVHSI